MAKTAREMGYTTGIGSCDGNCPVRGPRCSPCPQLSTEDNRTPIVEGMKVYNYYDGEWGIVTDVREADGWFKVNGTSLNGVRVSTYEPGKGTP